MFLPSWRRSIRASRKNARKSDRAPRFRPLVEALEDRQLLATFTVTNAADTGAGTLRQAILNANAAAGADDIVFSLPATNRTIFPVTALPQINEVVTIDGTTQPGFVDTPLVVLDGSRATPTIVGLDIVGGNSKVRGLVIQHFNSGGILLQTGANNTIGGSTSAQRNVISGNLLDGILVQGSSGNVIQNNFIGTDVAGRAAQGNTDGISFQAGANNNTATANVVSGNVGTGIELIGSNNNRIAGNIVGLDVSGTFPLGNGKDGVLVSRNSSNNVIGGLFSSSRNVISANLSEGIEIDATSTNNQVQGNLIGTDITGTSPRGNANEGVFVQGTLNVIGGATAGAGNVISGNLASGIQIFAGTGNLVQGNLIGVNAAGTAALGNTEFGVLLARVATGNTIGGSSSAAGNVIAGNTQDGVKLIDIGTSNNQVQGNFIGTDRAGTAKLGNAGDGVRIDLNVVNNTIGGLASGTGNVIAFNTRSGVGILSNEIAVLGNSIFDNTNLGIDLGDDGVPNPLGAPVLTSATTAGGTTTITGTLSNTPNATFRVELFSNAAADPSGFGEGQTFIGSTNVVSDASGNATFTVATTSAVAGQFLTGTATRTGTNPNQNTSEFGKALPVTGGSLTITKVDTPDPVAPGGTLTYTISVASTGANSNVVATDTLPSGVTFVSATSSTGTTTRTGNTVTANLGNLAAGATATVTIVVTAPLTAGVITNTVAAASTENPTPVTTTQNTTVSTATTATLQITKVDTPDPVPVNGALAYTITVASIGGANTNVVATDTLPSGVTFVSATASTGTVTQTGGTVTANLGTLAAGTTATLTIVVTAPRFAGTLTNNVFAASAESPAPVTATQTTTVTGVNPIIVAGPDSDSIPLVKVFDGPTHALKLAFLAYESGFRGGVRVAAGDVNGDGVPDVITGPGPTGGPLVRVFNGQDGSPLLSPVGNFIAYDPSFTGGIYVAAADINHDGKADIITGADAGGGPHVRAFDSATGNLLLDFLAYDAGFRGGVRVAAADVNGDGTPDILTAPGTGGGPNVKAFSGQNASVLLSFLAYDPSVTTGLFLADGGDTNGDGKAEIVTAQGPNGNSNVRVFSGANASLLSTFNAFAAEWTFGVRLAAVDLNGDGRRDIVTGSGPNVSPLVVDYDGTLSGQAVDNFFAYDLQFLEGIFVAASR